MSEQYGALDSHIKKMYYLNKDWFAVREHLNIAELQELFDVLLKANLFGGIDTLRTRLAELRAKYEKTETV